MNWLKRIQAAYYGKKYAPKVPYLEVVKEKGKDIVFVFNSFGIKDTLRSLGFTYNGMLKAWGMPLDVFKSKNMIDKLKEKDLNVDTSKPIEPIPETQQPVGAAPGLSAAPTEDLPSNIEIETPEPDNAPSGPYADTVNILGEGKYIRVFNSFPIYQSLKNLGFQFYDPRRPRKSAYRAFGDKKIWYMSLNSILNDENIRNSILGLGMNLSRVPELSPQVKQEPKKEEKIETKIPEKYLTAEQKDIENTFIQTNQSEMIEALAGTGKSSTLRHLSSFKKPNEKWLYLVFNKKNQLEAAEGAKRFAPGTLVLTSHAFLGNVLNQNARSGVIMPTDIWKKQGEKFSRVIDDMMLSDESIPPKSKFSAKMIIKKLGDLAKAYAILPSDPNATNQIKEIIESYAIDTDIATEGGPAANYTDRLVDLTLDALHYSLPANQKNKEYSLTRDHNDTLWFAALDPNIVWPRFDVVLADEVQDFNRCQIIMLKKLKDQGARIMAVGDENQCIIEGTKIQTSNGEVLVESLKVGDKVLAGCGRNNIKECAVTDIFKRKYNNMVVSIETTSGKKLITTPEHIYFAENLKKTNNKLKNKVRFSITLCEKDSTHSYSIIGNGWNEKKSMTSLKEIYDLVEKVRYKMPINVVEKARLAKEKSLSFVPAANLCAGMSVYIYDEKTNQVAFDTIQSVKIEEYDGYIYDINVEKCHNFIANNIFTHNSIYAFRGADFKAFERIAELTGSPENNGVKKELTKNFRCGRRIIDYVNQHTHVHDLQAGVNYDGEIEEGRKEESLIAQIQKEWLENGGKLKDQTVIISRVNKPLIQYALDFMKNDINFTIIGRDLSAELIKQVKRVTGSGKNAKNLPIDQLVLNMYEYLDNITKKWRTRLSKQAELTEIKETVESIESILAYLQQSQYHDAKINFTVSDSDTFMEYIRRRFVGLDTQTIDGSREYYNKDPRSSVILTTAHKAKGMEWNRVYIVRPDLFPHPKTETEQEKRQEENLWYVALTRARNLLSILAPKEE